MKDSVEKIVEEIDKSTMLGAAWDCLSDIAKDRFKKKLQAIIDEEKSKNGTPIIKFVE